MSVLKSKRSTSKAEYVNVANLIYTETVAFLTRLSARYARLLAEPVAALAGEVIDHTEKAKVDAGEMTVQQVREWLTSQIAYFENYNDHGRVLRLNRLFYAIYGGAEPCSRSSKTGPAWA